MVHLLRHVASETEEPEADVALEFAGTEHLGHRPRRLRSPHLELEKPVARGRIPLREEEVVLRLGVDVVDPSPVADDLDRGIEAGQGQVGGERDASGCCGCRGRRDLCGGDKGGAQKEDEGDCDRSRRASG